MLVHPYRCNAASLQLCLSHQAEYKPNYAVSLNVMFHNDNKPAAIWLHSSCTPTTHMTGCIAVTTVWSRATTEINHEMLCHAGSCDTVCLFVCEVIIILKPHAESEQRESQATHLKLDQVLLRSETNKLQRE